MCVGITIIKWDSTCHSQTHGTEPPVHFCCSHTFLHVFFLPPPFILSLSCFLFLSLSLSLSLSLYLCPLFLSVVARHMSSDALYQNILFSWSYLSIAHIKFSNYSPTIFYDLPSSELLEKHLFRSRANRRLVWFSPCRWRKLRFPLRGIFWVFLRLIFNFCQEWSPNSCHQRLATNFH